MIKDGIISEGNNFVISYLQSFDPNPIAGDDNYSNTVIFEITKDEKDSFTYENENLTKINAYIKHYCFCQAETTAPKPLLKGKITGTKLNSDTWKIEGTNDIVNVLGNIVNFSGEFKTKK